MITFAVSDVRPSDDRLPVTTLGESLRLRTKSTFEAAACNLPDLRKSTVHGFVAAVHTAFDLHHPLVLSPDDVWLCIAQGFATYVGLHPDVLRRRFVQHDGKATLTVRRDDFVKGSPSNDWPGVFSELSERIRDHVGKKRDLVVGSFSTTGAIERAATEVVLFDALQSYFDYEVHTLCGIPEITLLGTAEDWLSIRERAQVLAELDITRWTPALLPVLDRIVETARGSVDRTFWQSFYKKGNVSGAAHVTGWINVLFPYVQETDHPTNERRARWNGVLTRWRAAMDLFSPGCGPTLSQLPSGLSSAPFLWRYLGAEIPMAFTGGFVGISQDASTGAVRPTIGWAIGER